MVSAGEHVGDYEIEKELGAGGMARVYKARHTFLETVHALKILDPKYRQNAEVRKRFLDEAKLQAKHLVHPNIVKVTNIVATRDVAALVMEFIDGTSLDGFITDLKAPPTPDTIRKLMLPVLAGVGHAHAGGVVHRDIKPANILLQKNDDGSYTPKVTDFGIAKVIEGGEGTAAGLGKKSTHADARMGTLAYMSPEQIRKAKSVTARSDIFSLGAMLYELATRVTAFEGESDFDVMDKIVRGAYEAPERKIAGLDPVIAACIHKALQPDPAARFASCDEFARALKGELPVVLPPKKTTDPNRMVGMPATMGGQAGQGQTGHPISNITTGTGATAALAQRSGGRRWLPLILILMAVGAGGAATAIALSKKKSAAQPSPSPTTAELPSPSGSPSESPDPGTSEEPSPSPTLEPSPSAPAGDPGLGHGDPFAAPTGSPEPSPTEEPPASCAGTFTGRLMVLNLTDDLPGCGSYTIFESDTRSPCSGKLTSCTRTGDQLSAPFGCTYRGELAGMKLRGTLRTTCGGDSMTAKAMGNSYPLSRAAGEPPSR